MTEETSKINYTALREPFKEEEIQWRVIMSGKTGEKIYAIVAPYVDSRAIMDRLDLVAGITNWESRFTETNKGMICELTIDGVTKSDGADYTDIEPTKGGISDALKRAGNQWGMGRYLYSLGTQYAIITENGKHKGSTRDKTQFKWNPPKLPTWALPPSSNTEQPRKPEGVKQDPELVDKPTEEYNAIIKKYHGKDANLYSEVLSDFNFKKASDIPVDKREEVLSALVEVFS